MRPDKHRLTQTQKEADDFQWYREFIDYYDSHSFLSDSLVTAFGEYNRMRLNYELYEGRVDEADFLYITRPWGKEFEGTMPAQLTHRDISSTKIRALANMATKRALSWKVVAVNEDATTRKENTEFGMMRQYVIDQLMGQQPEQTPEEVRKYMARYHQDPAEALAHQLLEYFHFKLNIPQETARGVKHAALSGKEIYRVFERSGEVDFEVINPMYFDHDRKPGLTQIEKGEYAVAELRKSPHEIIRDFGEELTEEQIDRIYNMSNADFQINHSRSFDDYSQDYVRVLHVQWKSLRKEGLLFYLDLETGEELQEKVNEHYKLNKELGDISVKWRWVPEVHEGYKIGPDIYVGMGPVFNISEEPTLSYIGTIFDYEGGEVTSPMDRMRPYQYLYNIINYRMEILMAQDKGKKVLINVGAIPKSAGIDIPTFEYFLDANSYSYLNPAEEGNKFGGEITNLAKEIDLSNTSDIGKYQALAEWVDQKCGEVVGVPKQLEGQIQEREAVQNVNSVISLSTNVSGMFFQTHDFTVRRLLEALLNKAKSTYFGKESVRLAYVIDDLSVQMLNVDPALLANSSFGIFVDDSNKLEETKQVIQQFGFAAMQNGTLGMAYAIKAARAKSIQEAEEILTAGESESFERQQQMEQMKAEQQKEMMMLQEQMEQSKHLRQIEIIKLQEALKYERELAKQAVLALGFSKDNDQNNNNTPDVVDLMKQQILAKKIELEEAKLENEKNKPTEQQ